VILIDLLPMPRIMALNDPRDNQAPECQTVLLDKPPLLIAKFTEMNCMPEERWRVNR